MNFVAFDGWPAKSLSQKKEPPVHYSPLSTSFVVQSRGEGTKSSWMHMYSSLRSRQLLFEASSPARFAVKRHQSSRSDLYRADL